MSEIEWKARWIGFGQHPKDDLGVYVFRKKLNVSDPGELSKAWPIKVSADQRYQLTVNGQFVGEGPQRGDLQNWFYETYDISPFLRSGDNMVEARVWSFGRYAPMAQMTYRLAFVCEGKALNTPNGWEVAKVTGHEFEMMHNEVGGFYIDIGPGEIITQPGQKLDWKKPNEIVHVLERGEFAGDSPWFLIPRNIPAMKRENWDGKPMVVDRETNDRHVFDGIVIHPGEKLLLDFGELLAAYPEFSFDGATGSTVKVTFGEGLFDKDGNKNNRSDVRGKAIKGYQDRFILADNSERTFQTVWWRTWRYIQIESDQPVRLTGIKTIVTGYPYHVDSSFVADDPWVEKIWDVGIRTAKLCAGETYFDCPYYEQLQYVGDTRIQTLLHYYLSRDRSLARNAVVQFERSLLPNGLTQSRYPSRVQQIIPPFSLFWVLMLHDQMLYDNIESLQILHSYDLASRVLSNFPDSNGKEPFWFFFDWNDKWPMGIPRGGNLGALAATLKFLAEAARDHLNAGNAEFARDWKEFIGDVEKQRHSNGLLSEPGAEHVEALWGVLHQMVGVQPPKWPKAALQKADADKCTYYFQYYKHLAMDTNDYMAELEPWKEMIRSGLTTFAESPEPTRSDCHAWSAHPILGFFQIVAGVTSRAPGWKKARIEPRPGKLKHFEAKIALPESELIMRWNGNSYEVDSPIPFEFVWNGKRHNYLPGKHRLY